jgi:hypothetical protein
MITNAFPPAEADAADPLDAYGYPDSLREEESAHAAWSAEDQELRGRFATMLWIPIPGSITFDPREVRQWDIGTFYRTLTVRTDTLLLLVENGAIVTPDWSWIGLPAPEPYDGSALSAGGPGWRLESTTPLRDHGVIRGTRPPQ